MKTRETTPGKTYSVHTSSGCTVSDKNGWSKTIDAPDGYFTAHAGEVTIDGDDAADIRELFKLAPQQRLAILGVLGGNDGLPAGYKRVEYLESTGTQYMALTAEMQMPLEVSIDCTVERFVSQFIYGYFNKPGRVSFGYNWGSGKMAYGIQEWNLFARVGAEKRHLYVMKRADFAQKSELFIDGQKSNDFSQEEIEAGKWKPGVPWLFARNNNGSLESPAFTKIWSFSYKHGDAIDCNLIPCLDETGTPCMYDTVSKKPFYNSGTDDFLYPTESTTYSLRRVLPDWGKLTERGLRRLYHAPANYKGELYDYALENGYKPIIEPEKPAEGYWTPQWRETEDEIVLEWVETEPPMDEFGLPDEPLTNN